MASENRILASIPNHEKQALLPKLEPVILRKPQVLCEPDQTLEHAYFPTSGMVSLLSISDGGDAPEVTVVTRDGVIGPPILPYASTSPYQIVVRLSGRALRIDARVLQHELSQLPGLQVALVGHTHQFVRGICARVACHRSHAPTQRLSGWLLTVRDIAGADQFELTHDAISLSLALPRSIVTRTALELQNAGLIAYRHGYISIRNVRALATRACRCERHDDLASDAGETSLDRARASHPRLS